MPPLSPTPPPQSALLVLLFQPNCPGRCSSGRACPSPVSSGLPPFIKSPSCAHFTVGKTRHRETSHLLFALGAQLLGFLSRNPAPGCKEKNSGLGPLALVGREIVSSEQLEAPSSPSSQTSLPLTASLDREQAPRGHRKLPAASRRTFQTELFLRIREPAGDQATESLQIGLFAEKSVNTHLTTGDISSSAHAGRLSLSPCPRAVPEGRLARSMGTESSFPARQLAPDMGADAHSQGGRVPRPWQGPPQLRIASKAVKRR